VKLIKLVILLIVGVSYAQTDRPFVPYIDIEGIFYANYTGMVVEGIPNVAFTCVQDSLSLDSLLEIYPCVSLMDSIVFYNFVELRLNEF
jgi:hypothetical protein